MTKRLTTKQARGIWPHDIILRGQVLSVRDQYRILAMDDQQRMAEYGINLTPAIVARVKHSVAWWEKYERDRHAINAR